MLCKKLKNVKVKEFVKFLLKLLQYFICIWDDLMADDR